MKKLKFSQLEQIDGGSKCDAAMGAVVGFAIAGLVAGGPMGLAVGITYGLVGVFGLSQCD